MTARLTPLRAALVALAALAGLFAMHGLTHHGEHLPSHDDPASTHVAHHAMATTAAADPPTTDPVSPETGAGAMTACLTILLTGALVWAAVRRHRAGLLLRSARAWALVDRPRPVPRSHDPPSRWSLAVCRC